MRDVIGLVLIFFIVAWFVTLSYLMGKTNGSRLENQPHHLTVVEFKNGGFSKSLIEMGMYENLHKCKEVGDTLLSIVTPETGVFAVFCEAPICTELNGVEVCTHKIEEQSE